MLIEALALMLVTALLSRRLMERSMRQRGDDCDALVAGWDQKPTRCPPSLMMTTTFSGGMVIKIGPKRRLNREVRLEQRPFLQALHGSPDVFTQPRPG